MFKVIKYFLTKRSTAIAALFLNPQHIFSNLMLLLAALFQHLLLFDSEVYHHIGIFSQCFGCERTIFIVFQALN